MDNKQPVSVEAGRANGIGEADSMQRLGMRSADNNGAPTQDEPNLVLEAAQPAESGSPPSDWVAELEAAATELLDAINARLSEKITGPTVLRLLEAARRMEKALVASPRHSATVRVSDSPGQDYSTRKPI